MRLCGCSANGVAVNVGTGAGPLLRGWRFRTSRLKTRIDESALASTLSFTRSSRDLADYVSRHEAAVVTFTISIVHDTVGVTRALYGRICIMKVKDEQQPNVRTFNVETCCLKVSQETGVAWSFLAAD